MQRELQPYANLVTSVSTSSGTLLAADSALQVVELTNTSETIDVWVCDARLTAEVGKGFYLPADSTRIFDDVIPKGGLNAIADGGAADVAVGRG